MMVYVVTERWLSAGTIPAWGLNGGMQNMSYLNISFNPSLHGTVPSTFARSDSVFFFLLTSCGRHGLTSSMPLVHAR